MGKDTPIKKTLMFIVITFIPGTLVGYAIHYLNQIIIIYNFKNGENILKNSGFKNGSGISPLYLFEAIIPAGNLSLTFDNKIKLNENRIACISKTHNYNETVYNNWTQYIVKVQNGKTIELVGGIKTIEADSVVMVIQFWDKFYNTVDFGTNQTATEINGTNDWKMYNDSVYIPNDTSNIVIRLILTEVTGRIAVISALSCP